MKKSPTLVDVAKLANTSKATAARVFSRSKSANVRLETKARILEAADKLGYSPNPSAASLRSKKTYLIALCFYYVDVDVNIGINVDVDVHVDFASTSTSMLA